jgi:hypothetical protein
MKRCCLLLLAALLLLAPATARALPARVRLLVAPPPAGNDANPGTFAQPWATLDHASAAAVGNGDIRVLSGFW